MKNAWNKTNPNWWFYGLANYKWISVYPEKNMWIIFHQLSSGLVKAVDSGNADSPEETCNKAIKKAAELGFI